MHFLQDNPINSYKNIFKPFKYYLFVKNLQKKEKNNTKLMQFIRKVNTKKKTFSITKQNKLIKKTKNINMSIKKSNNVSKQIKATSKTFYVTDNKKVNRNKKNKKKLSKKGLVLNPKSILTLFVKLHKKHLIL